MGFGVGVSLGALVAVAREVSVGTGVRVGAGVCVAVGADVGFGLGIEVEEAMGVNDGVAVGADVGARDAVTDAVAVDSTATDVPVGVVPQPATASKITGISIPNTNGFTRFIVSSPERSRLHPTGLSRSRAPHPYGTRLRTSRTA